jgi:hypothetical protein
LLECVVALRAGVRLHEGCDKLVLSVVVVFNFVLLAHKPGFTPEKMATALLISWI